MTAGRGQSQRCARVVGDGGFALAPAGASHFQNELAALVGGRSGQGVRQLCAALLQPEPDAVQNRAAVAVRVRGHTVGYLDRDAAADFLAALEESGFADAACEAVIFGGGRRAGEDGRFGLRLNAVMPFALVDPEEPRIAHAHREASRGDAPRGSPRIVRIVKRRRGVFGWFFLLLFVLFNLFMAAWLAAYWPAGFPLAATNALGERIAALLGGAMGVEVIVGLWVGGAIVLGFLMRLVRGRNVAVGEMTEDWAKLY